MKQHIKSWMLSAKIKNITSIPTKKPHTHKICDIKKQNTLSGVFTFW